MTTKSDSIRQKLTSDSFWSFSGDGVSIIAGLATVKISTTWIESGAYGQASLLLGIVALLNGLLIGPLMVVHLRLYFDYLNRGLGSWYESVFRTVFLIFGCVLAIGYFVFAFLISWKGESLFLRHVAAIVLLILAQPYYSALSNYLEAHRNQRRLAILNLLHRGLHPCFLFLLLALTLPPTDALLVAQGLAILFVLLIFRAPRPNSDSDHVPAQQKAECLTLVRLAKDFGAPLPLIFLTMWLLTTGDRYMLQYFMTPKDVGRYAMNYGFWSLPFIFLNGWLEILTRPIIFNYAAKKDWNGVNKIIMWRIGFGMLACALGMALLFTLARPIAEMMLGDQYWVGIGFVMAIAAAHCFFILGYSIVPIFLAAKEMNMVLLATACAAVLNLAVNWFAIQALGLMGTALSTLISYTLWSLILARAGYVLAQRLPQSAS